MILELTHDQIITPGWRVIERETRRDMARKASARANAKWLRECRAKMERGA